MDFFDKDDKNDVFKNEDEQGHNKENTIDITSYAQNLSNVSTYGVANLDLATGIVMDASKAMNILGFPTSQTLENTSQDEISKAFLQHIRALMKKRKQFKGNNGKRYIFPKIR